MNKFLVLFAVVAAAAAKPVESDMNLLKRLLNVLQNEKRSTNHISFDAYDSTLTVSFIARYGVTGPIGHQVYVSKDGGDLVYEVNETQYSENNGGFTRTYDLSSVGLENGATYDVKACEVKADGTDDTDQCNTKQFTMPTLVGK